MRQLLNDPQQEPTPMILQSVLGENFGCYARLIELFGAHGITCTWNYYRDGKSWLGKAAFQKKTILWLSVWEDCLKTSFFFTEKSRAGAQELDMAPQIKEQLHHARITGKLIPLVLEVRGTDALPDIEKLIDYKKRH